MTRSMDDNRPERLDLAQVEGRENTCSAVTSAQTAEKRYGQSDGSEGLVRGAPLVRPPGPLACVPRFFRLDFAKGWFAKHE